MKTVCQMMLILAGLLLNVMSAYGVSDSLGVYLKIAATQNPTVLQRFKEYSAALQKVPQAGSLPDPQLEMGVFLSPMEVVNGKQVADIKLMQMFPWWGVLKHAKDEMSRMAQMKYELFRDAKLQIYFEVQKNWFDLYRVQREMDLTRENIELLQSIRRLSVIQFSATMSDASSGISSMADNKVGANSSTPMAMGAMGTKQAVSGTSTPLPGMSPSGRMSKNETQGGLTEVYEIDSELAELQNTVLSLHDQFNVSQARFNALLNRKEGASLSIPDTLAPEALDMVYLSMSDSLFYRNPMLGMLKFEQLSLDSRLLMQKKMGLPMWGVGLNYSVIAPAPMSTSAMNGRDMVMPMLTVTLPVYRQKYQSMQTETRLMKEATEANLQATKNVLRTSYLEAMEQYHDAARKLTLYATQADYLKTSLAISRQSYATGNGSLSGVLALRRRLLDYELKYAVALADFNTSRALVLRICAAVEP